MKKLNLIIAALHAGALAFTLGPGVARAQDAQEVRAYLEALRTGTAEAMAQFLAIYPHSTLPGSELGASIAAGIEPPTASIGENAATDHGWGGNDHDSERSTVRVGAARAAADDDGVY